MPRQAEPIPPEADTARRSRVRLVRVLRFQDSDRSMPRDVTGEQELPAHEALAYVALGYAVPIDETWGPDPRDCHAAAAECLRWLETERRRYASDEAFESVPSHRRRLERILALVQNGGGTRAAS
jgi:hypothetical protein